MKTLVKSLIVLGISLVFSFSANANNDNPVNSSKNLRAEIINLIGKEVPVKRGESMLANISFILNKKNEIIVLDVDSKSKDLNSFIKSRLQYKTITTKATKKMEVYQLPLRVK